MNSIKLFATVANPGCPLNPPKPGGLQAQNLGSKSPNLGDLGAEALKNEAKELIELT